MGAKHRRRRATKSDERPDSFDDPFEEMSDDAIARTMLAWVAEEVGSGSEYTSIMAQGVAKLSRRIGQQTLDKAMTEWLAYIVASVVESHWTPSDLFEVVTRRGNTQHLPMLAALLKAEEDRHPAHSVSAQWRDGLDRLPPPALPNLTSVEGMTMAFGLVAVIVRLPPLTETSARVGAAGEEAGSASSSKHLTRVRALLAKAESTESPEEAEALSAKAQELISRYALDRLLNEPADDDAAQMASRRIWIDAPYVRPKSSLISQIATVNRCRAVFTERLEFITVIGEPSDLDAVELMTASLLVQAQRAMVAHGSQSDGWGTSRTRSFRQSFLVSFASRIGQRLRAATDEAAAESGESKALVPVLQRHRERVDAACEAMFPDLVKGRRTSVTNAHGWAAGRAAADLASLDAHKNVTADSRSR